MSHPSAEEVRVATDALRAEAGQWEHQSGVISGLAGTVQGMELGRVEAGLFQLIVSPYNDVVNTVRARCQEGRTAMTQVAATLRRVAAVYEEEDRDNAHRIRGVY